MDLDLLDLSEDRRHRNSPRHNPFLVSPKPPARSNSKSSLPSARSITSQSSQARNNASGNSSFSSNTNNDNHFKPVVPPRPKHSILPTGNQQDRKLEAAASSAKNTSNTPGDSSSSDLIQW